MSTDIMYSIKRAGIYCLRNHSDSWGGAVQESDFIKCYRIFVGLYKTLFMETN